MVYNSIDKRPIRMDPIKMKTGRRTSTIVFNKIKTIPYQVKSADLNPAGLFVRDIELSHVKAAIKKGKNKIRWLSKANKNNRIDHDFMIDENDNIYALYDVDEQLAVKGKYGVVRLAQDVKTSEWLALKSTSDSEAFVKRELAILEATKQLRVKALGTDKKTTYILMPFYFGRPLSTLIIDHEHLQPVQYLKIAYNAMKALGKIHYANILHRDIKPDNILIDVATAEVNYVDFGFAGMGKRNADDVLECEGVRMGTSNYMSPEISVDEKARPYSEYSDIYALGVCLAKWFGLELVYKEKQLIEVKPGKRLETVFESEDIRNMVIDLICRMTEKDVKKRVNLLAAETALRKVFQQLGFTPMTDTRVALLNISEFKGLIEEQRAAVVTALKAFDQVLLVSPTEKRVKTLEYALLHHELETEGVRCMDQYATFKDYEDLAVLIEGRVNTDATCGYYHCCYLTTSSPGSSEVKSVSDQVICIAPYKDLESYQDDILRTYLNKAVKGEDKKKLLMTLTDELKKMTDDASRCKTLNRSNVDKLTDVIKALSDEDDLSYAALYNLVGKLKKELGYAALTANQPMWAPAMQEKVNMTSALLEAIMPAQRV